MQEDAEECRIFRYALRKFRKDCENFARIAKISQGLRKFRNPCEISLCTVFHDLVLCNSHFVPNVIIYFWYFWYFTHLV